MKLLRGENMPAKATRRTIHLFCSLVKMVYGSCGREVSLAAADLLDVSGIASGTEAFSMPVALMVFIMSQNKIEV